MKFDNQTPEEVTVVITFEGKEIEYIKGDARDLLAEGSHSWAVTEDLLKRLRDL